MPLELALLPVVESAFNPVAYSRSRASGLWQFIPSSGKHYGLEQNWWIDERRDVIEATGAALTYLQYLNNYFGGDWFLAIAAYNGGEGTVSAAVRRNQAAGLPTDFFSLELRAETRDYVPKLLAISRIVRSPDAYGLSSRRSRTCLTSTSSNPAARCTSATPPTSPASRRDDMFALNPGYNRMTTPPARARIACCCRSSNAEQFRQGHAGSGHRVDRSAGASWPRRAAARGAPRREARRNPERDRAQATTCRWRHCATPTAFDGSVIHPGRVAAHSQAARRDLPRWPRWRRRARTSPRNCRSSSSRRAAAEAAGARRQVRRHALGRGPRATASRCLRSRRQMGCRARPDWASGARLEIPGSGSSRCGYSESSRMTYKVRRGDTLSEIADRFNVSVRELMTWNRMRQSSFAARGPASGTLRRLEPAERRLITVGFLAGKRALIVGLATERSIAHGIAAAMHREGAELAFTYQGDRLKERVLSKWRRAFGSAMTLPMDVASDAEIDAAFASIRTVWDSLDIIVHSVGVRAARRTRRRLRRQHDARRFPGRARHLELQPHGARKGRTPADAGPQRARLITLSYLGAVRSIPSYNVMGLAKASLEANVRFLAADLGPQNIRVNAISAGPIKTLAAAGVGGFRKMLGARRGGDAAAPQRHDRGSRQRRRVPVLGPRLGHHGRECCTSTPVTATWACRFPSTSALVAARAQITPWAYVRAASRSLDLRERCPLLISRR